MLKSGGDLFIFPLDPEGIHRVVVSLRLSNCHFNEALVYWKRHSNKFKSRANWLWRWKLRSSRGSHEAMVVHAPSWIHSIAREMILWFPLGRHLSALLNASKNTAFSHEGHSRLSFQWTGVWWPSRLGWEFVINDMKNAWMGNKLVWLMCVCV